MVVDCSLEIVYFFGTVSSKYKIIALISSEALLRYYCDADWEATNLSISGTLANYELPHIYSHHVVLKGALHVFTRHVPL